MPRLKYGIKKFLMKNGKKMVKLLKGSVKDWPAALIFAAVLAAALLTDLSPVIFVAGAAALGIVIQNFIRRAK